MNPTPAGSTVEGALAPCPFCNGGRAYISDQESAAIYVACRDCGAQMWGHRAHFADKAQAGAAWNRRASLSPSPDATRLERHALAAKDCPPDSRVVLLSSLKRMYGEIDVNGRMGVRPGLEELRRREAFDTLPDDYEVN